MIIENAYAKLNLFLRITGKTLSNYHLINSLFVFTEFSDKLKIMGSNNIELSINGPFSSKLSECSLKNNLVYKAAHALQSHSGTNLGAKIELTKNIPICAGIGGGSADAAAVLRGLNNLWELNYSLTELAEIGLPLGADVPSCVFSQAALISGIGEISTEVKLPSEKIFVLLVNPNLPVSTPEVFKKLNYDPNIDTQKILIKQIPDNLNEFLDFIKSQSNDLYKPAIEIQPIIQTILDTIESVPGCHLARMSGSGATCFGIFTDIQKVNEAQDSIKKLFPSFWVIGTMLL